MSRKFIFILTLCGVLYLFAKSAYDVSSYNLFYDQIVCEEKNITSEVLLTPPCTEHPVNPNPGPYNPIPIPNGLPIPPPSKPPIPIYPGPVTPQTEYKSQMVPMIIVNNTGFSDEDLYITIFGNVSKLPSGVSISGINSSYGSSNSCSSTSDNGLCQNFTTYPIVSFVSFGTDTTYSANIGTIGGSAIPSASSASYTGYSYKLSNFPKSGDGRLFYIPSVIFSGEILFSLNNPLKLSIAQPSSSEVPNPNPYSIAVPNPSLNTDDNYDYYYAQAEFTFYPPNSYDEGGHLLDQFSIDITCVNYFGLPLQLAVQTGNSAQGVVYSGIFQGRSEVLGFLKQMFDYPSNVNSKNEWNKLILTNAGKTVRVLATGFSMTGPGFGGGGPIFDLNYFDNAASYGYSWAENVWTGSNAYWKNNKLTISTKNNVFVGQVNDENQFVFSTGSGNNVQSYIIPWQDASSQSQSEVPHSTTAALFSVSDFLPGTIYEIGGVQYTLSSSGSGYEIPNSDSKELTKILSSTIIAGIIPGFDKLTNAGPSPSQINMYYTLNNNLLNNGASYGPWFDLYSAGILGSGLNTTGNIIYTYPYSDYLYTRSPTLSNVAPLVAEINNQLYVQITLNDCSDLK